MSNPNIVIVSACLAGLCTRYDGRVLASQQCQVRLKETTWIPVCPEQLGGLATPRCAADISGGSGSDVLDGTAKVMCKDGTDVTQAFLKGAEQVLEIARRQNIERAFLKARSPSCGVHKPGVTAMLLKRNGIQLEEFD
jgi:uncharacterized protein YbbK (DUF523 family)